MKIYSEKTNKEYKTVADCLAAEEAYDKEKAAEKAKKEELTAKRKERAAEVDDAFKAILEAKKVYKEKLDAFVKDYGAFHCTVRTGEDNPFNLFDTFFDRFWF